MAGQFTPPPGYVPLNDGSQPETQQPETQPVQAQPVQPAQAGRFAPPPGYVPLSSGQPTQAAQPSQPATQPGATYDPVADVNAYAFARPTPKSPTPTAPPADHKEQLVHSVSGDTGLQLYRFARNTVDRVESLIEADPKDYPATAANLKAHINTAAAIGEGEEAQGTGQQVVGKTVVYPAVRQAIQNVGKNIQSNIVPEPYNANPELHDFKNQPIFPMAGVAAKAGDFAAEEAALAEGRAASEKAATATAGAVSKPASAAKTAKIANEDLASAHQDFKKAVPSTKSSPYEDHDMQVAEAYAEQHHANVEPIRNVKDFVDATDHSIKGIEDEVSKHIKLIPNEPIATDVLGDVRSALSKNERGAEFVSSGMKEIKALDLGNITMERADSVRRQLNMENQGILQKNNYDLAAARASDPGFAAREAASESLRNGIYNQFDNHGIEGTRELRLDEGSLLKVRNAAYDQIQNGDKIVKGSSGASFGARVAGKTVKGAATLGGATLGSAVAGPVGALAGGTAGSELGGVLEGKIAAPDISRNALIERRFGKTVATVEPAQITVPKGIQSPPIKPTPVGTQSTIPGVGEGHVPATPAASTRNPAQADLFGTPATPPAAMQSPQAELASLKSAMRPLQAILNDPMATAAAKAEATRQLSNLPLESLRNAAVPSAGKEAAGASKLDLHSIQDEPLQVPKSLAKSTDTSGILGHEHGHAYVAHLEGFPVDEIQSHLHPNIKGTNIAANTRVDISSLNPGKSGLIPKENMKANIDKILTVVMGGAAADTVHRGVPLAENAIAYGDLKWARNALKEYGYTEAEAEARITAAHQRAVNHLSDPDAYDMLKETRDAREPGLDKTLHVSKERLQENFDELDRRQNDRLNRGLKTNDAEHSEANDASGEGGSPSKLGLEASNAGLKETTTGDGRVDQSIRDAGAIPAGKFDNLAMFHDPKTGSTLALNSADVTPEAVQKHLAESRAKFGVK